MGKIQSFYSHRAVAVYIRSFWFLVFTLGLPDYIMKQIYQDIIKYKDL